MIQSICIHSKNFYSEKYPSFFGFCCCSVSQSCLTLCNPMDCSTPGLPVLHYLLEFGQTHVHWVDYDTQPSYRLLSPSPPTFSLSPASRSFPGSKFFASVGQSIGVSSSVLPMNIQGWFHLGLPGLISLLSKGLSRVFSRTIVRKYKFLSAQA